MMLSRASTTIERAGYFSRRKGNATGAWRGRSGYEGAEVPPRSEARAGSRRCGGPGGFRLMSDRDVLGQTSVYAGETRAPR